MGKGKKPTSKPDLVNADLGEEEEGKIQPIDEPDLVNAADLGEEEEEGKIQPIDEPDPFNAADLGYEEEEEEGDAADLGGEEEMLIGEENLDRENLDRKNRGLCCFFKGTAAKNEKKIEIRTKPTQRQIAYVEKILNKQPRDVKRRRI